MTPEPLAVLLLPGSGDADATRASIRAEAGADVAIAELGRDALSATAAVVAFARPGDRWRAGALESRLRALAARPAASLSIAGHVLVDAAGEEVLAVPAPRPPLDPAELLLHASVEPSAVLVRAQALDATARELLAHPHGEAVVWSRLAADGFVRSSEVAAEVPLDPARHGTAPRERTAALAAAAAHAFAGGEQSTPGATAIRRELLRRLYLDAEDADIELDLASLLGDDLASPARAAAIVADLQWALERQREALRWERVRWPEHVARDEDAPTLAADEELFDLRAAVMKMSGEVEVRDALIRRYEAELKHRDAAIARLSGERARAAAGGAA